MMRIFGFKWSRFAEWRDVLNEERKRASLLRLLVEMALVFIKALPHLKENRRLWRSKMRKCQTCPVYDRSLHRCRPYTGSPAGCGCSVWLMALWKKHCWITENLDEQDRRGHGW